MADDFSKSVPDGVTGANSFEPGYPSVAARLGDNVSSAPHSQGHAADEEVDLADAHGGLLGERSSADVDLSAVCPPLTDTIPGHGLPPIDRPPPDLLVFEAPERFPIRIRLAIYVLASTLAWALVALVITAIF